MKTRQPNLTISKLLEAVATAKHKTTSEIASLLGYQLSGVLIKLHDLESKGLVTCEQINKRMFVWSLAKGCFGSFMCGTARCKACLGAVECHGVSVE